MLPKDFNQNPANSRLDTDRSQLVLGYDLPLSFGLWGNTLAYTDTHADRVRGLVDTRGTPQPWTVKTIPDLEAFKQSRHLRALFIDSHLTTQLMPELDITTGVNLLMGAAPMRTACGMAISCCSRRQLGAGCRIGQPQGVPSILVTAAASWAYTRKAGTS